MPSYAGSNMTLDEFMRKHFDDVTNINYHDEFVGSFWDYAREDVRASREDRRDYSRGAQSEIIEGEFRVVETIDA